MRWNAKTNILPLYNKRFPQNVLVANKATIAYWSSLRGDYNTHITRIPLLPNDSMDDTSQKDQWIQHPGGTDSSGGTLPPPFGWK